ncbi:hypothetical protein [Chryseobacterium koreense]|uniref:Uncharacterized protein n=1 Tax=Chryseobacterium koreense CCUG 49689 TaxID=1304281 RepID=A0A0J7IZX7_9FLAO|nr:hypothetical protein [Chryseobacterium koreense]KMQ71758.1 hypothetical protein ACM44_05960 [Chryseobacterium koreense CCUG 49689]MBB5334238.1 branched-subunit amino acid transport protein [Chryseobacterium koreense]
MTSDLLVSKNMLYPIALFGLIFGIVTVTFDLRSLGIPLAMGMVLPFLALICNFITVAVLIVDVFKNNLSAKYLWTLAFLFAGCIAGVFYLMNRTLYLPMK